ncbi:MAG TPA: hypothetical protein PLE19_02975 [Planctomycetota bacterium]|nr:hypothetical protein [Planctomycetota bacterium]HRT94372.1 hypothetical protein [Planctomycetota bacterium]
MHPGKFRAAFGERLFPLPLEILDIREGRPDGGSEPLGDVGRHLERAQFLPDDVLQVLLSPPKRRMVTGRIVVGAPVIDVLADTAVKEFAPNALAGHGEAAVRAPDKPAGKQVDVMRHTAVPAIQDVLARLEGLPVDEEPVLALVDTPVAMQFADVEPVIQDVGQSRPVEARLARSVNEPFRRELVPQALEGVPAGGVELEDAKDGLRLHGMGLDRLVLILHVKVAVRRESRGPSLADLLVHAFQDLGA